MRFGRIDNIILFGGSPLLAEFAKSLKKSGKYRVTCFSCGRQLNEIIGKKGETLKSELRKNKVTFYDSPDICRDRRLNDLITGRTLGLGFGEPWNFDRKTIDKFGGKLLDFMGIPLPKYRGGAHYTWQIMRKDREGCCNLQVINEDMIQGVFDSGKIVKSKRYFFPASAKIPQDYFDAAVRREVAFLREFLKEIGENKVFKLKKIKEKESMYFPRLYTLKHGFIDWNWKNSEIATFIRAFDDPYKGASTFLGGKRVYLKNACAEKKDGNFHPFQYGLVYRKYKNTVFVAARDGGVAVKKITGNNGKNVMNAVRTGGRFFTPRGFLEESMLYRASYDTKGAAEKEKSAVKEEITAGKKRCKEIIDKNGRIYLKNMLPSDVTPDYCAWLRDRKVTQFLEARFSKNSPRDVRAFVKKANNNPNTKFFAVRLKNSDMHIGNVKLHRINRTHRSGEISILIGKKECWGKGYGTEAINLISDYAFGVLGMNKLSAECYANNKGSLKAFKKAGFQEEGIRKKQYLYKGDYEDACMLGRVRPTERKKP